jgi:hypothetical protein
MIANHLAQQLHDKATRGVALSAEEQAQLEQWYARQDQAEEATLSKAPLPQANASLQTQVDGAVAQLLTVTQRIQTLAAENDALRREVVALRQQLTEKLAKQPA